MKTVSFFGECAARTTKVLVSQPISHPYEVTGIRASFSNGCFNLLRLEVFISNDGDAASSGKPSGTSVLSDYGQVDYVVGNDEQVNMLHNVLVDHGGSWLKVYADNRGYEAQDVSVQITILPLERGE